MSMFVLLRHSLSKNISVYNSYKKSKIILEVAQIREMAALENMNKIDVWF